MQTHLPPFSCTHTPEFPELLAQLNCSLIVSTYQAGKAILISSDGERLTQLSRQFDTPMGLAVQADRLAIATKHEVIVLVNAPGLATSYPNKPDYYDALFVPQTVYLSGQINLHDMSWIGNDLIAVNTMFSCLCRIDPFYHFVSLWKPSFITNLASEDRCHLNGLAMEGKTPRYVSALGASDNPQGWRDHKLDGGILVDVPSGEILLTELPMPHSPRIYDGKLYLLLSATGELVTVDVEKGTYDVINQIPGFVRGMSRHGDYVFIGTSLLRKKHPFGDLPLPQNTNLFCGVLVLHLPTGAIVGQLKYENSCEEIYDVQVLPGLQRPGILRPDQDVTRLALSIPEATFWAKNNSVS